MAFRPQYKNKSGKMVDLPLDAETVRGKEVYSKDETETLIAEKLDEKQTTKVNCSHEVEITGFGEEDCNLVIDDQDVVLSKIQGQTRRKSLNLLNIADVSETTTNGITYSIKDGVINLNGTATTTLFIDVCVMSFNGTYYAKDCFYNYGGKTCNIKLDTSDVQLSANKSFDLTSTNERVLLRIENGMILSNVVLKPMIVSGNTPPTYFEPYDNTLVNSKCDFVSTGRNLAYKKEKGNWGIYLTCNYLEKGKTYYVSDKGALSSLKLVDIYICDKNKENDTIVTSQAYFYFSNGIEFTIPTNLSFNPYVVYVKINSNDFTDLSTVMINYGDTALPYEPYVEDTMQCGIELGAFDYHDNINHITHRQTSKMITLNGSESWEKQTTASSNHWRFKSSTILPSNSYYGGSDYINTKSNWIDATANITWVNGIGMVAENNYIFISNPNITTVEDLKTWLASNPITFVYELRVKTTEENVLPSGYKVWYKGMQVQKTDTIPYILTKQYAISLASQVLNNVSIDRSQQKQIEELKENKANSSDIYKKSETDSLLNGRFGKWRFENGSLYSGVNPIVGDYYELVGTCTTLGNEDYDTLIIGYDSRPKYFEAGTIKVKDIALLEDVTSITTAITGSLSNLQTTNKTNLVSAINEVKNTQPHLFRHQIRFSDSASTNQVSFEIILASPTAINTKNKIKAILTDNYYNNVSRAKIAIGTSLSGGYLYDAIYINNGELFAREITTPSAISIEEICVSIEDTITQIF